MNGLATPEHQTSPQHLRALARANKVRLARAELKRQIAEGQLTPATVFLETPWEAESMSVSDVLMSQRRWGATRCRKFLSPLQIPENKPVGSLTERQRKALSTFLTTGPAESPRTSRAQARHLAAVV
jgi:hypothetical protein